MFNLKKFVLCLYNVYDLEKLVNNLALGIPERYSSATLDEARLQISRILMKIKTFISGNMITFFVIDNIVPNNYLHAG